MTGQKPVLRMQQIRMWKAGRNNKVTVYRDVHGGWWWDRLSANAVRAARVEAELTGARLVIQEAS